MRRFLDDYDDHEAYMLRQEFGKKRKPAGGCSDGFCGAEDCPTCFPNTWDQEREDEPEEEEEAEEEEEEQTKETPPCPPTKI